MKEEEASSHHYKSYHSFDPLGRYAPTRQWSGDVEATLLGGPYHRPLCVCEHQPLNTVALSNQCTKSATAVKKTRIRHAYTMYCT